MDTLRQESDAYGLVHADLHMGNFFVDHSGQMTVFDFDDCCFHWFGYDCAVSVVSSMPCATSPLEPAFSRRDEWGLENRTASVERG